MERKIGEIFEYNSEWCQCVEGDYCEKCDFYNKFKDDRCSSINNCSTLNRKDNKNVIFKKLEKVGEPYMAHDHSRNKDVVVQDYKLYNQHACYTGHEEMLSFGLYGKVGMVTIKSKEPIKSLNCENSVDIEIKQNKEDMSNTETLWYGPDKKEAKSLKLSNLKPFSLEAAKQGKPVCTRDGRKARIICFDKKCLDEQILIALVDCGKEESMYFYTKDGKCVDSENNLDLMMLPEKKEGWAKIRKDVNLYNTKEEADRKMIGNDEYVTAKVCWEE